MSQATPCRFCGDEFCLVHCIYCLADCSVDDPEHAAACPFVTGQWPQDEDGLCCRCNALMPEGSSGYRVLVGHVGDIPMLYEVVCLSCKAAAEVLA